MDLPLSAPLFAVCLVAGMLALLDVGRRIGVWRISRDPAAAEAGLGAVEGAVFALFGLLLAFTFSGAGGRYDSRRMLIAEEANDIGTAYLRIDLLPETEQPALRAAFRAYLDSRLETYRKLPDLEAAQAALARSNELQGEIWRRAVAATRLEGAHPDAAKLLLPALNAMIDITTTRTMAARIHPPRVIYVLLFVLGLGCALMAGYGMAARKERSWLHILGFVAATGIAAYVILDLEYPRLGRLRIDAYDQVLVELLETMKE